MKKNVILPIFNEEFLLPYWLRHHVPLFDHGVILNDSSSDRSVEICRELAPDWTILNSRRRDWDELEFLAEVQGVEEGLDGWKFVIQATEFLMTDDLSFLDGRQDTLGLGVFVMVDPDPGGPLDDRPLWEQRRGSCGYEDVAWKDVREGKPRNTGRGARFVHCQKNGAYELGRHGTRLPHKFVDDPFLLWYGWAPWPEVKARRLQFASRISERDKARGWNGQHLIDGVDLERRYEAVRQFARPFMVTS